MRARRSNAEGEAFRKSCAGCMSKGEAIVIARGVAVGAELMYGELLYHRELLEFICKIDHVYAAPFHVLGIFSQLVDHGCLSRGLS